jgi:hypothetical protein
VHLVTCGLYMSGYSAGFGDNIGGMFSASDFITITIQHLIKIYILSLGFPLAIISLRYRSGFNNFANLIAQVDDTNTRTTLSSVHQRILQLTTGIIYLTVFVLLLILFCQAWTGAIRDYYGVMSVSVLGLLPTWYNTAGRLKLHGLPVDLAWCSLVLAVSVVGLGLDSGEHDRRTPYASLSDSHMHCGKHIIVSPIGSRFISVTTNDQRHIIDENCKPQFDFAPTTPAPLLPLYDLVKVKLTPSSASKHGALLPRATPRDDHGPGSSSSSS